MPSLPFVKVAEQEDMKLALMLNVIDPTIGGVLIMGERGTGKSVAVRAMVDLLPEIEVVAEDAFNSHPTDTKLMGPDVLQRHRNGEQLPMVRVKTPLVELPLGATEDRICGTINIEKALQEGVKAYEPGLLAKANRGILYVDEVNLLDDGLVDVVLDSSASGVNTVEREGIGIVHPAKFIMIGSGNPQEGEMRPQLLDRFGMSVNVATMQNIAARTRMVLDRIAFENDPDAFCVEAEEEQAALRAQLTAATEAAPGIAMARELKVTISEICSLLDVDGIRGDITTNKAARALAAFESKDTVTIDHVRRVIGLCLNHRLRKDPLETIDSGTKVALAFRRITDPQRAAKEEKAKKEAEAAAAKAAEKANKKAGAWGGLPGPKR
ncbi:magnesium-chelatase subunit [Coccomyxa subellipsoidea C-169]|uniref:magnesium chelatase n=1 Tax=Coccomyxa subellipsoidea (strain C-169) TaxID=574566 RepID=I0Z595_COCSC|nr:magnesium-chelatase subunit [Coccomyxa subellipsoidea C-169]EIE25814.1 magnesium-chelatase subunit [Coccomyxa subellipsoidea C-169]|eukprot:XP_005650358.1 magnesium-chelatase subunit [Coccomyxa subellipsoidea C-169]